MRTAVLDSVLVTAGDVFSDARRLGFSGIELTLERAKLRSAGADGELARLRRASEQSSLNIHALILAEHNHGGIAATSAETASAAVRDVEAAIEWAAALGAEVVLVPFFLEADLRSDADFDRCADAFAALCPLAERRGVTLCYEGLYPAARIRGLAERVASPGFGCYFDLANPLRRGLDPATEIRALGELVRRVHVKDSLVSTGDVRPGIGRVPFTECAVAFAEIGYDGWLTLETPPAPPPLVARDRSFTRSVFPVADGGDEWPRFGAFSYDFGRGRRNELASAFRDLGLAEVVLGRELLDECLEDDGVAAATRRLFDENGLCIPALAGYRNLVAPDPETRQANVEYLARCLELAPALGAYVVCTETGTRHAGDDWTDSPSNWGVEAWRLLEDALETLLPVAERSGTILALEAHAKNVVKTRGQMIGILERHPSAHLQLVCDPYNYLSAELLPEQERETRALLDRFESRFVAAHLKDVAAGGAEVGTPELGTGVFEQRPYLEFLRTCRPDLALVVEHLPLENVPRALERVRALAAAPEEQAA